MGKKNSLKEVVCFGQKIKIKYEDLQDTLSCGLYHYDIKEISIHKDLNDKDRAHTIVHEMVHAFFDRTGLNQTTIPFDLQEILCENLATFFLENFDFDI